MRHVETRVVDRVVLAVAGFVDPVTARLIALPDAGPPRLNRPLVQTRRLPAPGALDEVALNEVFAAAHHQRPGDTVAANIAGKRRMLAVVGTVTSPEYGSALAPGGLVPDDRRFGVGWTRHDLLAAAVDMEGAFNDVSLRIGRGVEPARVIAAVDRILTPCGALGAIGREDQLSNGFLSSEIRQLATIATVMPAIFLAVAAFLLHMATARVVAIERETIGLLKAFGYRDRAVGWHYVKSATATALAGASLGVLAGWWLGLRITVLDADVFRFPFLIYGLDIRLALGAVTLALAVAALGALGAVGQAVRLGPAEAMRPPVPAGFGRARGGPAVAARCADDGALPARPAPVARAHERARHGGGGAAHRLAALGRFGAGARRGSLRAD